MKKILLISNRVHHYRSKLYNYFTGEFESKGFEFHVLSNSFQEVDFPIKYTKHELAFNTLAYIKKIKEINPVVAINFLHLKDKLIFPLTLYCRMRGTPMIYWGHGLNLRDKDNNLKNRVFRFVHTISSAIILYTPNELKYISKFNRHKTFIAYNTQLFPESDRQNLSTKEETKEFYQIREDFVVLFISRIMPYKGLDYLIDILKNLPDIGLVIVGPGISQEQLKIVNEYSNIYYLGEKYGAQVNEIFQMGDVFSTPGHIGLALNQAFFWGKPVVVLESKHAPEIFYMTHGKTGFIAKDAHDLKEKIVLLSQNRELLHLMSENASSVAKNLMSADKMFEGFRQAVSYCLKL